MENQQKVALLIMDGWGHGQIPAASAIQAAQTPFVDSYYTKYPYTELVTFGEAVGLPVGQMGNSEVGHLNLGAGRIVYQELQRIHVAIQSGEFAQMLALKNLFQYCLANQKPLHLMGLVSDGGVHAHTAHLVAICKNAAAAGLKEIYIHAFTDGRDTDPKSGISFLKNTQDQVAVFGAKIVSVCGRYYAMDRDKRWERVKLAYDLWVHGIGEESDDLIQSVQANYAKNVTDEFLKPLFLKNEFRKINPEEAVFCFNFRTDRCREITEVLTQKAFPEFGLKPLPLYYVTMTQYDESFQNVQVIFRNDNLKNTLGEVLAQNHKTQLRAAETEKYPHVTFFFSGGQEAAYPGENRVLAPSPKVATYDLQPEMSAPELAQKVIDFAVANTPDFICLNFANADMVGHTGVFEAVVKACETVDACVGNVISTLLKLDYQILLTADHGNADFMVNADGTPNTAHTMNPVPLFLISAEQKFTLKSGKLGDLAPTILNLMQLPVPAEMKGESLLIAAQ